MKTLTPDIFKLLQESDDKFMIKFESDTCAPCKTIAPQLEKLEKIYTNISFWKLDVDKYPEVAQDFEIQSIPMMVLIKGKNEIERTTVLNNFKNALERF